MGLLERVGALIRANLNDLIDRAENPEKMLKQLMLDMQNQLMQLKTQVAVAVADQHLLESKRRENETAATEWLRKAEVALGKARDDLARDAVDKGLGCQQAAANYAQQFEHQKAQVEQLKSALVKLERKLAETRTEADLLITRQRRARAASRTTQTPSAPSSNGLAFDRMREKVLRTEALGAAHIELAAMETVDEISAMEREERIEQVLTEIRKKRSS
jgi:phage shock protein A